MIFSPNLHLRHSGSDLQLYGLIDTTLPYVIYICKENYSPRKLFTTEVEIEMVELNISSIPIVNLKSYE